MPRMMIRAFTYLLLTMGATLGLAGTAHAMGFNDDAELNTSQVSDDRGCGTDCPVVESPSFDPDANSNLRDDWNPNTDWNDYK